MTFFSSGGKPYEICIDESCNDREELIKTIESGGGIICDRDTAGFIIVDENTPIDSNDHHIFISSEWIRDTVSGHHQANIEKYLMQADEASSEQNSPPPRPQSRPQTAPSLRSPPSAKQQGSSSLKGRKRFSEREDKAIVLGINKLFALSPEYKITGTALWKKLENDNALKGHTWQSIKDRYLKYIKPKLNSGNEFTSKRKRNESEGSSPNGKAEEPASTEDNTRNAPEDEGDELTDSSGSDQELYTQDKAATQDDTLEEDRLSTQLPFSITQDENELSEEELLEQLLHEDTPSTPSKSKKSEGAHTNGKQKDTSSAPVSNSPTKDSTPQQSNDAVQELRFIVSSLADEFGVHTNVVWHALIVHSGNLKHARGYLQYGGDYEVRPWMPSEDAILLGQDETAVRALAAIRGKEACIDRAAFLADLGDEL